MTLCDVAVVVPCHTVRDGELAIAHLVEESQLARPNISSVVVVVFDGVEPSARERQRLDTAPVCVIWLPERRGPYRARNAGIRASRSRLVALTDSDCVPARGWLQAGVSVFESAEIDMLGGAIVPALDASRGPVAAADFAISYDQERLVAEGHAAAGNLWFRRNVFDRIGGFDESLAFGGDTDFTSRARAIGLTLTYSPDVLVRHPALDAAGLTRRYYRRGRSHQTRVAQGSLPTTIPVARVPLTTRLRLAYSHLGRKPKRPDVFLGWVAVLVFIHLPWRVGRGVAWASVKRSSSLVNVQTRNFGHNLRKVRQQIAVGSSMVADLETAMVCNALRDAQIRVIVLKGFHHQSRLYGVPRRASVDVDLLVERRTLTDAERILAAIGYEPPPRSTPGVEHDYSSMWTAQGRFPIDLHWSLSGADPELLWDALSGQTVERVVHGSTIEVPNDAGLALISALHAAQHGARNEEVIGELARALQVIAIRHWQSAWDLAERSNASAAFSAGLSLTPRGRQLLDGFGAPTNGTMPFVVALRLATPPETAHGFYWLGRQTGLQRVWFLGHKLVPPLAFMRDKYAIANRGRAGLLLAYLYRPLWLAWWAPRGYLAWRHAKRTAAASQRDASD